MSALYSGNYGKNSHEFVHFCNLMFEWIYFFSFVQNFSEYQDEEQPWMLGL